MSTAGRFPWPGRHRTGFLKHGMPADPAALGDLLPIGSRGQRRIDLLEQILFRDRFLQDLRARREDAVIGDGLLGVPRHEDGFKPGLDRRYPVRKYPGRYRREKYVDQEQVDMDFR